MRLPDERGAWLQRDQFKEDFSLRYCESPNSNARPDVDDISLIVIHGISLPPSEFGGPWIDALFLNKLPQDEHPYFKEIAHLTVSAHICIKRKGDVVQYVPFNQRAWHAGVSSFQGRQNCNDFSIGIELEGADDILYEEIQYQRLAELVNVINQMYPKTKHMIVGHSDIAPGRKTDPGASFSWDKLDSLLIFKRET